jgi:hypothetical protein
MILTASKTHYRRKNDMPLAIGYVDVSISDLIR